MKEIKQNGREIRVQDNTITENANGRALLTFSKFIVSCCFHAKPKDAIKKLERRIVLVKAQ